MSLHLTLTKLDCIYKIHPKIILIVHFIGVRDWIVLSSKTGDLVDYETAQRHFLQLQNWSFNQSWPIESACGKINNIHWLLCTPVVTICGLISFMTLERSTSIIKLWNIHTHTYIYIFIPHMFWKAVLVLNLLVGLYLKKQNISF